MLNYSQALRKMEDTRMQEALNELLFLVSFKKDPFYEIIFLK